MQEAMMSLLKPYAAGLNEVSRIYLFASAIVIADETDESLKVWDVTLCGQIRKTAQKLYEPCKNP
jgi:hypothetical protein